MSDYFEKKEEVGANPSKEVATITEVTTTSS
jgi:hypothetical protein